MSIPSLSYVVQIGAIAAMASSASFQSRPCMLELSSTRKTVSKSRRKEYWDSDSGSSGPLIVIAGISASEYGGGRSDECIPDRDVVLDILLRPRNLDGVDLVFVPALRSLRSLRRSDEKECQMDGFSLLSIAGDSLICETSCATPRKRRDAMV